MQTDVVSGIREQFPALEREHNGHSVAYFDGPGGTQVPRCVAEAMLDYLYHHNANTHWAFPTSAETDALLSTARSAVADFLNADASGIAFGNNMTSLTFHVSRAIGRGFGPGDEILVTELDHHANIDPWRALAKERGVTIRSVRMIPETGLLDMNDLRQKLSAKTKLLAIGAASNALGTMNDIASAVDVAHSVGALVFVDAVHYAPHRRIDVRSWNCDLLACSAYKFYGPHVGILYGKPQLLGTLDFAKLEPAPENPPERLETGTQNHEGICGTAVAINFLASIGTGNDRRSRLESAFATIQEHEMRLFEKLWTGLCAIPRVRVFGPPPSARRSPTLSFGLAGHTPEQVSRELAKEGLFVSHGDFYATTAIKRLGYQHNGLVRIGCSIYTTDDEIARLLESITCLADSTIS